LSKVVVLFGLAGALLFSGELPALNGALMRKPAEPPSWLSLPPDARIAHIDFSGAPGAENKRGTIRLRVDGDTPEVLSNMSETLAHEGFVIEAAQVETSRVATPMGFMRASDPETGRSVTIMLGPGSLGSIIRISFNDPSA
jgi:hypothetical protein